MIDRKDIRAWVDNHRHDMLRDIAALVAIPSVSVANDGPRPYGDGCATVLEKALAMAGEAGLVPQNHEYRCGTARLPGKKGGELCVLAHLDIVPEGTGWTGDPFTMETRGDWLIGRGVSDDKGPAVAALYAARCLKELGAKLDHDILLYFGLAEEKGMSDLEWYRDHFPMPDFSFTPDTAFPVCNGEKGILELDASIPLPVDVLVDFHAGLASNIVPEAAHAVLRHTAAEARAALTGTDCTVEELGGGTVKISATGIAGHAAHPEGTRNAMAVLAAALAHSGLLSGAEQRCVEALGAMFADSYGAGLGVPLEDEASGKLTHNGGLTRVVDGTLTQNINIRYPVTADQEAMIAAIRATLEAAGFTLDKIHNDPPCFIPADAPMVTALTAISNRVLGKELEPYVMGGGTYARKLKNAVGFGPGVPDRELPFGAGRGGAHQPVECASITELVDAVEIYALALLELDTLVG